MCDSLQKYQHVLSKPYQLKCSVQLDRKMTLLQNWEIWIRTKAGRSERKKYSPTSSTLKKPFQTLCHTICLLSMCFYSASFFSPPPFSLHQHYFHHRPFLFLSTVSHVPVFTTYFLVNICYALDNHWHFRLFTTVQIPVSFILVYVWFCHQSIICGCQLLFLVNWVYGTVNIKTFQRGFSVFLFQF